MHKTVIVGNIGLDDIETPFGRAEGLLGGAGTFAAFSASFFAEPSLVGVVGEDLPDEYMNFLRTTAIDLSGLTVQGKTFRWGGYYEYDMNDAHTIKTELNNFEEYTPEIPDGLKDAEIVFLTNAPPTAQKAALKQFTEPKLVVMDTMNFWIEHMREDLLDVLGDVDVLVFNDGEARMLFETSNLYVAAQKALSHGLDAVIIKKGEHGALLFTPEFHFSVGGYPMEDIYDPTGCGDVFGGGFVGYLAKHGISKQTMKRGVVYGSVMASFNAQNFSCRKLMEIAQKDIECRYQGFQEMHEF